MNHNVGKSHLECLIKPIFWQVCNYLSLDTNCSSFTRLSSTISSMFDVTHCCPNSFISLTVPDPVLASNDVSDFDNEAMQLHHQHVITQLARCANQARAGRSKYIDLASRISITSKSISSAAAADTALALHSALKTGSLQSLCLREILRAEEEGRQQLSLTEQLNIWLFSDFSVAASNIRELWIERSVEAERFDDWSGLEVCTSLVSLHLVGLPVTTGSLGPLTGLIDSLPASLERFVLASDWPMDVLQAAWSRAFSSPDYLPLLKYFRCERWNAPLALAVDEALATTIMTKTGAIRPIENWTGLKDLEFIQQLPVRYVVCRRYFREEVAEQLLHCPPGLWPNLTRLDVFVYAGATDVLPLLAFACTRPLVELRVFASAEGSVIPLPQNHGLTDSSVQALARMSSLRALQLTNGDSQLFLSDDLTDLIPRACWPNLSVLELECGTLTEKQISSILCAAPSCSRVKLVDRLSSHTNVLLLAMVLHYMPSIIRVQIALHEMSFVALQDVINAFARYPGVGGCLLNLVSVELTGLESSSAAALHRLAAHLKAARRLQFLDIPSITTTYLSLSAIRALSYVRCIHQLHVECRNGDLASVSTKLQETMSCVMMQQSNSPLDRSRLSGDSLIRGDTLEDILADRYPAYEQLGVYPAFKQYDEESARSGGDLFFEWLLEELTADEKALLTAWDAGDYSVDMAQNK